MPKKPMLENTDPKPEPDLASKKKELTEAMKKDMNARAEKAREKIAAVCKEYRVEIVPSPNLRHVGNGQFLTVAEAKIIPLE